MEKAIPLPSATTQLRFAMRLTHILQRTIFLSMLTLPANPAFAQSPDDIMRAISDRYERHANGHLKYERRVYLEKEVPINEIRSSPGIVDKWATSDTLKLWDSNDYYWETKANHRYRIDAVNLLSAQNNVESPAGSEALNAAFQNYNRTYVKDTKNNQQILAYRNRGTSGFAHILRTNTKSTVSPDPSDIYDAGLPVHYLVFSQFVYWDSWSKRYSQLSSSNPDETTMKLDFKRDGESYSIIVDPTSQTIRSYEYLQESGDASIGTVPLLHVAYSDYDKTETTYYPRTVRVQLYEPLDSKAGAKRTTHMNATTIELKVTHSDFDNPAYSERIEFAEIAGNRVEDHTNGVENRVFHEAYQNPTR